MAWGEHSLCRVSLAPFLLSLRCGRWVSGPPPFAPGTASSAARDGGGGTLLAAARAHAGLGTRRVRARARAPRLQPSARSRLRCHSQLPGAAASPGSGAVSAGPAPLALSQEDELKEDAWAREYSGGGPIGSGAQAKDGPGAEPLPAAGSSPWPRVAASDPRLGQPLPQPTAEGGRGEGGRQ